MITLSNITKTVTDGRQKQRIVDGVNLTIHRGEFIAIVGPSGSGKSTLLNILGLLDKPTQGDYTFHNEVVSRFWGGQAANFRSRRIGFVFQSFMLLPRMTVLQNVELPLLYIRVSRRERRQRALEALRLVGLETKAKRRALNLSGGEKQRVAIARALVNNPDLILADEPTGNLDESSKSGILDIFSRLRQEGRTIVMVTHDLDAAAVASRVLRIQSGKLKPLSDTLSIGGMREATATTEPAPATVTRDDINAGSQQDFESEVSQP